MAVGEAEKVH